MTGDAYVGARSTADLGRRHPDRFGGRVALVTGAAAGIGRAVSVLLAAQGAAVVVADVDAGGAHAVADEVTAAGGTASAVVVDLADRPRRAALVPDVLATWGRLDVLVNSAAWLGDRVPGLELAGEDWDRVLETNLTAPAFLSVAAAADMARRGNGAIVNLASLQERLPMATHTAYVSSKGGLAALTRSLAVELAPHGVRVNAVVPAVIDSPSMTATLEQAGVEGVRAPTLLRRYGRPEEVADAVAFLASDEASYITATLLHVDGGRAVSRHPDELGSISEHLADQREGGGP